MTAVGSEKCRYHIYIDSEGKRVHIVKEEQLTGNTGSSQILLKGITAYGAYHLKLSL
jgi:hypothetical protein